MSTIIEVFMIRGMLLNKAISESSNFNKKKYKAIMFSGNDAYYKAYVYL